LSGLFTVTGGFSGFDSYAAGSSFSDGADGFSSGSAKLFLSGSANTNGMKLNDDNELYLIYGDTQIVLSQASDGSLYFMDPVSSGQGTVYYLNSAACAKTASLITGETGYVLSGNGSVLTIDEDTTTLTDGIKVDAGSGAATVLLTSGGKLDTASLSCASGTLNLQLKKAASDYSDAPVTLELSNATAVNGSIGIGQGSQLLVSGTSAVSGVASVDMAGGAGNEAQLQVTTAAQMGGSKLNLNGNAIVSGSGSLVYAGDGTVAVSNENNSISAAMQAGGTLKFDVAHTDLLNGSVAVTGSLSAANVVKSGEGTLTYGGSSLSGNVKVSGGSMVLDSSVALSGLELAGGTVR
jgi:hypothetical protein